MITGIDRLSDHLALADTDTDAVGQASHVDGAFSAFVDELRRALAAAFPHAATDSSQPELYGATRPKAGVGDRPLHSGHEHHGLFKVAAGGV